MSQKTDHQSLAREVAQTLTDNGFRALYAGGCVRDLLRGTPPRDYDIATNAVPEEIRALFPKTVAIGASFGVIVVLHNGVPFEVTTFRSDGEYLDGRHPSSVEYGDERGDAQRRDFTINGLFMEPGTGEIIDYVGGRQDIENRLIRTIGNSRDRFLEDRLRMLRAVRFHAELDFRIDDETLCTIRNLAPEIRSVSGERIRGELVRILTGAAPHRGFLVLEETGLLQEILPEVAAMKGVRQPPKFHPEGDVWTHTLLMLEQMESPSPELAMGVLLHDVGKPGTFTEPEGDRIRFHRHDEIGAHMAEAICRRLRFSRAQTKRIESLVADHMRFTNLPRMRESRLRRFLSHDDIEEHLELHRLDCLGSHRKLDIYEFCRDKLAQYASEPVIPPPLITGRDVLDLGCRPGPDIGRILTEIQDAQLEQQIATRDEALAMARAGIAATRNQAGGDTAVSGRGDESRDSARPEEETGDDDPEEYPSGAEQ